MQYLWLFTAHSIASAHVHPVECYNYYNTRSSYPWTKPTINYGIVVGGVVVIMIIITAIITIIIMYLLCIKHNKQSWVPPSDYETPVETSTGLEMKSNTAYGASIGLQMKSNSAYGQVIHTTDKPTTDGAVYETVD